MANYLLPWEEDSTRATGDLNGEREPQAGCPGVGKARFKGREIKRLWVASWMEIVGTLFLRQTKLILRSSCKRFTHISDGKCIQSKQWNSGVSCINNNQMIGRNSFTPVGTYGTSNCLGN